MLDHIGVPVRDLARSKAFYETVLASLGYGPVMELDPSVTGGAGFVGFGRPGKPQFWISNGEPLTGVLHVAFMAENRAAVAAFHAAALAAGARDNGGPGLRPHYHPNYYGAFVFDPDGHNIEAVCHRPE
ncbi:VOC family protein [Pinisolibacter sp.]|uniref:VOC family protein n=1 Tax=Pinisolibacter sp. TaxID=2172024 RepID=UPI002FDC843E